MPRETAHRGCLLVLISSLGYGTLGLWGKFGYRLGFTPLSLQSVRFAIAALFLWLLVLATEKRLAVPRGWWQLWLQGGLGMAPTALCFFYALHYLPVGLASILFYLHPLFTNLAAIWVFGEAFTSRNAAALTLAIGGAALLANAATGQAVHPAGIAFALGGALAYSLFSLAGQSTSGLASPLVRTAHITLACAVSINLLAGTSWSALTSLTPAMWGIAAGLALVATVMGMLLYLWGITYIGATRAAIVAAAEPLSGVLLAALVLGERLTGLQTMGALLVVGAILCLQRPAKRGDKQWNF